MDSVLDNGIAKHAVIFLNKNAWPEIAGQGMEIIQAVQRLAAFEGKLSLWCTRSTDKSSRRAVMWDIIVYGAASSFYFLLIHEKGYLRAATTE